MQDSVWMMVRYLLIGGGMFLAGRGKVDQSQVPMFADGIINILGGGVSLGTAAWGLWVKWNTKPVPIATANRSDVPTVNSATGAVQP